MSLCSCGHTLGAADRFCPRCGTAAADQTPAGPTDGVADGPASDGPVSDSAVLLGVNDSATSVQSTSEVRSSHRGPWLIAGAVVMIGLAWALFARPGSDTSAEGGQSEQEAAAQEDAEEQDQSGDDGERSTDTTDITDDDADSTDNTDNTDSTDGKDHTAPDADDDQSVSSTDLSSEDTQSPDPLVTTEPVVGESTGLWLAVGSYDYNRAIQLIDLDTGTEYDTDVRGIPVGVIGTHLVYDTTDGSVEVVDLGVPEAEPVRLGGGADYVGFGSVANDLIWLSLPEDDEDMLLRAYTVDGELSEELPFGFAPFFSGWNGDSDLIYDNAGGVYERSGDGYNRVSNGLLQAAGSTIALVRDCDDQLNCRSQWFRRSDWEPLPYPEPPYEAQVARLTVVGQERLLTQTTWNGRQTVIDIESGTTIREVDSPSFGPLSGPAISDDGRWLFELNADGPVVVDLRSNEEWPLELSRREFPSAVFIDLDTSPYDEPD